MVYRVYVEKKPGFALEADALLKDIRSFLRIESLKGLRLLNRFVGVFTDVADFGLMAKKAQK